MSDNLTMSTVENKPQANTLNDNAIIGYIKSIWDRYKIVVFIVFAIVVISFIELSIATNISDCTFTLQRGKINVLVPSCLKLRANDCVYVFKSTDFNKLTAIDKANIPQGYLFKDINEHIATQITKPAHSIKNTIENFNNSSTPINDISNNIMNLTKINNIINPFNVYNNLSSKWLIFYPSYIKPKCFINKHNGTTKIYFN